MAYFLNNNVCLTIGMINIIKIYKNACIYLLDIFIETLEKINTVVPSDWTMDWIYSEYM